MAKRLVAFGASFWLLLGLVTVASVAAPSAFAYQGCNSQSSASANPSQAAAGEPIDFTATIRDCNGNGVGGAQVSFAQGSGPAGCTASFNPTSVKSDASGVAQTTVTLPAGCPCQYTLTATGAGTTVTVTVRESGCLPFTAAAARSATASPYPSLPVMLLLALGGSMLVLSGGYLMVTRKR